MENQTIPTLEITPQPIPAPPATTPPKKSYLPLTLAVIVILFISIFGGIVLGKYLYGPQNVTPTLPTGRQATLSPNPTLLPTTIPTVYIEPTQSVYTESTRSANWKTYTGDTADVPGGLSIFSIKYPAEWQLEGRVLYPEGKSSATGQEYRIVLGGGGHGVPEPLEKKVYPAGEADYYWKNEESLSWGYAIFYKNHISYTFYIENVPPNKSKEIEKTFNFMLSTFRFD